MNIAQQQVQDDWIIELIGHDQSAYNITLQPQEMLIYESHSILYGQPYPLLGQYYANCYLYFEPIGYADHHSHNDITKSTITNEQRYYKTPQEKFDAALAKQQERKARLYTGSTTTSDSISTETLSIQHDKKTKIVSNSIQLPNYIQEGTIEAKRYRQQFNFHRVPLINLDNDNMDSNLNELFPLIIQRQSTSSSTSTSNKKTAGATSAHVLAARNDIARIREIAKTDPKSLDKPDSNGWLPIHEAARGGSTEVVLFLIEEYGISDINARTNNGKGGTPLWWAEKVLVKNHKVIQILKRNGAVSIPPYSKKKKDISKKKD
jgi:hypothetical protein